VPSLIVVYVVAYDAGDPGSARREKVINAKGERDDKRKEASKKSTEATRGRSSNRR